MNKVVKRVRGWLGMSNHIKVVPDEDKVARYVLTGLEFANVTIMTWAGQCVGFEELLDSLEVAEHDYAGLGYKTLSIDDFIDAVGWGMNLKKLRIPRDVDEKPVYHAVEWRKTHV